MGKAEIVSILIFVLAIGLIMTGNEIYKMQDIYTVNSTFFIGKFEIRLGEDVLDGDVIGRAYSPDKIYIYANRTRLDSIYRLCVHEICHLEINLQNNTLEEIVCDNSEWNVRRPECDLLAGYVKSFGRS